MYRSSLWSDHGLQGLLDSRRLHQVWGLCRPNSPVRSGRTGLANWPDLPAKPANFPAELSGLFGRKNHTNDPQEIRHRSPFEEISRFQVSDPTTVDSSLIPDGRNICHMV